MSATHANKQQTDRDAVPAEAMPQRQSRPVQVVFLLSLGVVSWLGMMAVHEIGHCVAAWLSGGAVERVVLHPFAFSRTDVSPNPHPLFVVWCGPVVGVLIPIAAWFAARWSKRRWEHVAGFFAGFCLIANGAYIGIGALEELGDAGDMQLHGSPMWLLVAFGVLTAPLGLYVWHLVSGGLGFGREPRTVAWRDAVVAFASAVVVVVVGLVFGTTG